MSDRAVRDTRSHSYSELAVRAAVVTAVLGFAGLLWQTIDVLVLVFGAIIVAVALRSLVLIATRYTPLRDRWALLVVAIMLLAALVGLGTLIGSRLAEQFGQLTQTVQSAWMELRAALQRSDLGRMLLQTESQTASVSSAAHLAGVATTSIDALADLVLILFVGLFLAAE